MRLSAQNWPAILLAAVLVSRPVLGAANGDPGEGGGDGNEIGTQSEIVRENGGAYLNPLTGQPTHNVTVLGLKTRNGFGLSVDFSYGGFIKPTFLTLP